MSEQIRFHLDEHIDSNIARGLRRYGIDVTTTVDAGLRTKSDESHLAFIRLEQRVIVSCPASKTHIVWYNIITFRKSQCLLKTFSVLRQRKLCNKH